MVTKRSYGVGARLTCVVACAMTLLVAACSSGAAKQPEPTTTAATTLRTQPRATGLTAEQLSAHLGVGVPSGWVPVDLGEARVWVPARWMLEPPDACVGNASAAGAISVGSLPGTACDSVTPIALPKQAVALLPASRTRPTGPSHTVHGYKVYLAIVHPPPGTPVVWIEYQVPQLGVQIDLHGSLGSRVLDTLAPSARKVASTPGGGARHLARDC